MKASSCLGLRFGILIFRERATLLAEEIQDLPEDTTLMSSACFPFLLIFLSPMCFLIKSRLCLLIFCSIVFSYIFFGLLSMYCLSSVSRSVFVPNFAISEFRTRTSCRFGSLITLAVGLTLHTVLPGASTSYSSSRFFLCRWLSCIFQANFTWMLLSEHEIGLETPSDLINRCSPSFIFCSSFLARAFAAQMTFSISVSEHRAVSAYCSSVKYAQPGIVSSSKQCLIILL